MYSAVGVSTVHNVMPLFSWLCMYTKKAFLLTSRCVPLEGRVGLTDCKCVCDCPVGLEEVEEMLRRLQLLRDTYILRAGLEFIS